MVAPHTVYLPEKLDTLLQQVALASQVSTEDVLLSWIQQPIPSLKLDYKVDAYLTEIDNYDTVQLWTVVYRSLPNDVEMRHKQIVTKHEVGYELNEDEKADWQYSSALSELDMLLRAKALAKLKEDGENLDIYLKRELG